MRLPSYRKHSSGQARVTIGGRDHMLGPYGSPESKEAYGRLIAEYSASNCSASFAKAGNRSVLIQDVILAYLKFAKQYYANSSEYNNFKLAARPIAALYASLPAEQFGAAEYKAVRQWWMSEKSRSRQSVNKQMKRALRIVKWAVGEGMMPPECHVAIKCVDPLKRGRCEARESKRITCVPDELVDATLPHLTQVQADMVRFQRLTGCRPGELCKIKPAMVNRSSEVWEIHLEDHKTAYRGKERTIYVGPQAQAILKPYLVRAVDAYCFSPIESEKQRRQLLNSHLIGGVLCPLS